MTTPNTLLTQVRVEGFRSIKEATVDLGPLNVLIGPNGAGKSNFLSILRLVQLMRTQSLRRYVGEQGGADRLLHYGNAKTTKIRVELEFRRSHDRFQYAATLAYGAGTALYFDDESVSHGVVGVDGFAKTESFGSGYDESRLAERARDPANAVARAVDELLERIGFFHFHDTSVLAPLRQNAVQADNEKLRWDGSNLAAVLHRLKRSKDPSEAACWNNILGVTQQVAPFIKSIETKLVDPAHPETSALRLHWTDLNEHLFDAHDLSDGTLRAITLVTALFQPPFSRPDIILVDEPELGLHPAALSLFAAVVRSRAVSTQILLATQSSAFIDEFLPDEVIVAEYRKEEGWVPTKGESAFRRLDVEELKPWLEDYSLAELYDKNVLGGRP